MPTKIILCRQYQNCTYIFWCGERALWLKNVHFMCIRISPKILSVEKTRQLWSMSLCDIPTKTILCYYLHELFGHKVHFIEREKYFTDNTYLSLKMFQTITIPPQYLGCICLTFPHCASSIPDNNDSSAIPSQYLGGSQRTRAAPIRTG